MVKLNLQPSSLRKYNILVRQKVPIFGSNFDTQISVRVETVNQSRFPNESIKRLVLLGDAVSSGRADDSGESCEPVATTSKLFCG